MKPKIHPELSKVHPIWKQIKILKEEIREEYPDFMLSLPNESPTAKAERRGIFVKGFRNPTTVLLSSKGDAIFKKEVLRNKLSPSEKAFVESADKSGQSLEEMVQNEVCPTIAAYGTVFAIVDKPAGEATDKADELANKKPFLTILDPDQPIDWAYGSDGALLWFQYYVAAPVDRTDPWGPVRAEGWKADKGIATWTRAKYEVRHPSQKDVIFVSVPHGFGFVPVVIQAQYVTPNKTVGISTFFSSSDYLVMGNELNCASNMEVFKNSNSTLAMDVQDWDDDQNPAHPKDPSTHLVVMEKQSKEFKNVLLYQKNKPEYIVKDLDLIDKAADRAQAYFDMAIDNEKRGMSAEMPSSEPAAPQSGISKGYDFEEANGMLASLAAALERFEIQAVKMAGAMLGDAKTSAEIAYPQEFDTRNFMERLDFVKRLKETGFPSDIGKKEAYKALTPEISPVPEMQKQINAEIDAAKLVEETPNNPKKGLNNGNT